MLVSGFTFVRNAIELDYPVTQAIRSVLPLVDEFVVAVGNSTDETRTLIEGIAPDKIRIVDTVWDDSLRKGGVVLARETDKAKAHVHASADWLIYIQADEVIHEQYHEVIRRAMNTYLDDQRIEGLLLDYVHFYGSYDYVGDSRTWYRHEIRVIRNLPDINSWKDAQGFRRNGKKLAVKHIQASVYHYGWVRHPSKMMAKAVAANKLWHSDAWVQERFNPDTDFDYSQIDSLKRFNGSHPAVMQERIQAMNWTFDHDPTVKRFGFKAWLLYTVEKLTGYRIGEHKNFRRV